MKVPGCAENRAAASSHFTADSIYAIYVLAQVIGSLFACFLAPWTSTPNQKSHSFQGCRNRLLTFAEITSQLTSMTRSGERQRKKGCAMSSRWRRKTRLRSWALRSCNNPLIQSHTHHGSIARRANAKLKGTCQQWDATSEMKLYGFYFGCMHMSTVANIFSFECRLCCIHGLHQLCEQVYMLIVWRVRQHDVCAKWCVQRFCNAMMYSLLWLSHHPSLFFCWAVKFTPWMHEFPGRSHPPASDVYI